MTEIINLKVSTTIVLISKDNKTLIIQRPKHKSFPNKWVVPGGKVTSEDGLIPNKDNIKYYSVEDRAIIEILEEVGVFLSKDKLQYLCSLTLPNNVVVISFYAIGSSNADDVKITLSEESQDYKWITESEIKNYDFVAGMGEEIKEVFKRINNA